MGAVTNGQIARPSNVPRLTLAELRALNPASYNPSQLFHVSDVGVGGSYWYSSGVRWRLVNHHAILYSMPATVAHSGTPGAQEQMATYQLAGGLHAIGDILQVHMSFDAPATDAAADSFWLRAGPNNTSADSDWNSASQITNSGRTGTMFKRYRRRGDTDVLGMDPTGAGGLGGTSANGLAAETPPSVDAGMFLGAYYQLNAANTRIATLQHFTIELFQAGA